MTIEKWLADVYYDDYGTHIWNRENDEQNQLVADVRGWGRIQNEFADYDSACKFQDEIGEFIVQAIREKIARTSSQTISDEEIENESDHYKEANGSYSFKMAIKWYREQIKTKQ